MSLIKFNQLLTESGDLQLLHTAANISVPKIHRVESGASVAVHRTSTGEHADWLKGKFDKALNHNPSKKHIKIEVHHDGDNHEVHITHTPPKEMKENVDQGSELLEVFQKYNTGDHVHLRSGFRSASDRPLKHGIVGKSSERTAEVHWEDGTKSKHLHTSGKQVGQSDSSYSQHIHHNEVHDPEKPGYTFKRVTNDEHKNHIKKVAEVEQEKRDHQQSHRNAIEKLSGIHHSQLKPHHLKAIHDILDRARAGHD